MNNYCAAYRYSFRLPCVMTIHAGAEYCGHSSFSQNYMSPFFIKSETHNFGETIVSETVHFLSM